MRLTTCPPYATVCPASETLCPKVPTVCHTVETLCPKAETACPKRETTCPTVETRCPAQPTSWTTCPVRETICPATETIERAIEDALRAAGAQHDEANVAWTRASLARLQQVSGAQARTYLNFAGLGEEAEALVRGSFGVTYERLRQVKRRYDPDNLFRSTFNVRPG